MHEQTHTTFFFSSTLAKEIARAPTYRKVHCFYEYISKFFLSFIGFFRNHFENVLFLCLSGSPVRYSFCSSKFTWLVRKIPLFGCGPVPVCLSGLTAVEQCRRRLRPRDARSLCIQQCCTPSNPPFSPSVLGESLQLGGMPRGGALLLLRTLLCPSQQEYYAVHSYVTPLPQSPISFLPHKTGTQEEVNGGTVPMTLTTP